MIHEFDFAHVEGMLDGYARVAAVSEVQSCEIDLDRLLLRFVTRFPLTEATRTALRGSTGLLRVRCWPALAPRLQATDSLSA